MEKRETQMTKILVIEDEEAIRDEIVDWLQFEGYEVIGAENGLLGLDAAVRETPNLIVSDIVMPEMDGYGVLEALRADDNLALIPFIFLTARADHTDLRAGMELGASDYLTKPFTRHELLAAIQTQLARGGVVANLRQAKERADAILVSHPDAILIVNEDGRIETAVGGTERIFGHPPDTYEGQMAINLIDPLYTEQVEDALKELSPERSSISIELKVCETAREPFAAQLTLQSFAAYNDSRETLWYFRDTSHLKESEARTQRLVSNTTHELRTPLVSLRGFSEILLTRQLEPERQQRYLSLIHRQAVLLEEIVNDLLDVSRMGAGHAITIANDPVDLRAIIEGVLEAQVEIATDHHFELDFPALWPAVSGDAFRLEQVIRNLVSNAVKYSPTGGTVTIRGRIISGYGEISVQDQGIGMTPEQYQRLFEPFFRANDSIPGTGLGLTICKLIVEAHGGDIWADSLPGTGSTFFFTVPLME
jgi:PAS domain S-box-containing protein